ncbi:hypothetical protein DRE_05244 [Drechslerella stenobrocha 248]|uniref:Uncharacterized protein n=1 Tax=Drechslerella stenobrocha 248 TaxID=1043628 RepID=W7I0E4_9PEZI|nr:hypothetical protein DRE_05244 [Drechslerella stenobrocha 248]
MAVPPRRFSVFQRNHRVTVGPLGFDIPLPLDTSAFPTDDQVDEADRLSDVEYPDPGYERESKRRRIEENARDYLSRGQLEVYTASLRGPVLKSYWGKKAKVTGTILDLKASELKDSILAAERGPRKLDKKQALISPEQHRQVKLTTTLKVTKAIPTPIKDLEELLVLDSQQVIEESQLSASPPLNEVNAPDSLRIVRPTFSATKPLRISVPPDVPARTNRVVENSATPSGEAAIPESSPGDYGARKVQPLGRGAGVIAPALETVDESTPENVECIGALLEDQTLSIDETRHTLQQKSKQNSIQAARANKGDHSSDCKPRQNQLSRSNLDLSSHCLTRQIPDGKSSPQTERDVADFDVNHIGQIIERLEADETTNIFCNGSESMSMRSQSPSTALKKSLPKMDGRKSSQSHPPPSPTTDAILRKALKPPAARRRGDIGTGKSLKDIIAGTSGASKLVKWPRKPQISCDPTGGQRAPSKEARGPIAPYITPAVTAPAFKKPDASKQPEQPSAHEHSLEEAASQSEKIPHPDALLRSGQLATQMNPPVRLSQLPTPLPPSPLQLLNAPKQGAPNIPETVKEEALEKSVPLDVSLKENDPALKPGRRRAKRTAPTVAPSLPIGSQPSSNEELKAVLHARKLATPLSRLQKLIDECSPVSPMLVSSQPISPMQETQLEPQNQTFDVQRQERLREGQHNFSSQLSSPPPSSPPEGEAAVLAKAQQPEAVAKVLAPQATAEAPVPPIETNIIAAGAATGPAPGASGAPPSPPQEMPEEDESTIPMSSGHYRRIEESLRNPSPVALPLAVIEEASVSHVSASHPEQPANIPPILPDKRQPDMIENKPQESPAQPTRPAHEEVSIQVEEPIDSDSTDSEDLDLPPRKRQPPKPSVLVPGTPLADTQAGHVYVPDSFRREMAEPINYRYETPVASLAQAFVSSATGGFTPTNTGRGIVSSPVEPKSTSPKKQNGRLGPFTSPLRATEFTPFREFTSPPPPERRDSIEISSQLEGSSGSVHEPTTIVSPFTFSQFMKPGIESQYEVSRLAGVDEQRGGGKGGVAEHFSEQEQPASYDLENVLGGVEDYLMSDVYDVDEEARLRS